MRGVIAGFQFRHSALDLFATNRETQTSHAIQIPPIKIRERMRSVTPDTFWWVNDFQCVWIEIQTQELEEIRECVRRSRYQCFKVNTTDGIPLRQRVYIVMGFDPELELPARRNLHPGSKPTAEASKLIQIWENAMSSG